MDGIYLLIIGACFWIGILFSAYRADYEIGLIPSLYPKHYVKLSPKLRKFCIFKNKSGKTWILKYLYVDVIVAYICLALGILLFIINLIFPLSPDITFILMLIQVCLAVLDIVFFLFMTIYYQIRFKRPKK